MHEFLRRYVFCFFFAGCFVFFLGYHVVFASSFSLASHITTPQDGCHHDMELLSTTSSLEIHPFSIVGSFYTSSTLVFDARSSCRLGSNTTTTCGEYWWDLGDGSFASSSLVEHQYGTPTRFVVTLMARNYAWQEQVSSTIDVTIQVSASTTREEPETATELTNPDKKQSVAAAKETIISTNSQEKKPRALLRLNEIFPAPSGGHEWIELASETPFVASDLLGWSLSDSTHTIFRFTTSSLEKFEQTPSFFLRIDLSSMQLTNKGEWVRLVDAYGETVDALKYGDTPYQHSWIRVPDLTGEWQLTRGPTPFAKNQVLPILEEKPNPSPPLSVASSTETTFVSSSAAAISATASTQIRLAGTGVIRDKQKDPIAVVKFLSKTKPRSTSKTSVVQGKKITIARTKKSSKKSSQSSEPKDIAMFTDISKKYSQRVRLQGITGSVPGLLKSKEFLVHTPDGRGLLVLGNGRQPTPPFGMTVELTGMMLFDDKGPRVRMYARDLWQEVGSAEGIVGLRSVNLSAPAQEDAWSVVEATGTIREIQRNVAWMDTDNASIGIVIRPPLKYRAARLRIGDLVHVRGVLDTREEETRVYPRFAQEITLVQAARRVEKKFSATADSVSTWAPFGAAGVTIAMAHGWKKIKKIREQKRLNRLLEQARQHLAVYDQSSSS